MHLLSACFSAVVGSVRPSPLKKPIEPFFRFFFVDVFCADCPPLRERSILEGSVLDEIAMVAGLKAGSEEARIEFWHKYWDVVYPICSRMLNGASDATDTSVDLLVDFISHYVHKLEEPKALYAYVRLMAIRRSQALVKRHKDTIRLGFDPIDELAVTAEETVHWQALNTYLDDCLNKLTPKARQVLRLKYGQHLNNVKIGQALGTSKQYVSRLVITCLQTLKKCIESTAKQKKLETR